MAGLLNMAASDPSAPPVDPAAAPAADPSAPPADQSQDDGSNVTPEEQAQYNQFVENGMHIVYLDGKVNPDVMKQLEGKDPLEALARTTVWLVTSLKQSATAAKAEISDDVLYHGGVELFEQLGEVSQEAGIHDYSQEELEGSMYRALDLYRELGIKTGDVNEDDLKAQFGEIQQADEAGQIDKVLPGISSAPAPKPEPAPDQEQPEEQA